MSGSPLPRISLIVFRRLNHADQSGQNAQHSTFGAGRNKARRWRLGIQAAIAWAIFGGKDAGLAFEAENRAVDVRLAGEHAGVVDQIARGEIVGAVDDDVEVAKDFERVVAGQPRVELRSSRYGLMAFSLSAAESSFLRPTSAVSG